MTRREHWIPILVLALSTAFLFVSWLVFLSRGHPRLIRGKLRLGALLLGLTGSAAGCGPKPFATCYEPAPIDRVSFDAPFTTGTGLVLDLSEGSELTGEIVGRSAVAYSFQLLASGGESIQLGALFATDGAFDESIEAFRIPLEPTSLPAETTLRLYRCPPAEIDPVALIDQWDLTVVAVP